LRNFRRRAVRGIVAIIRIDEVVLEPAFPFRSALKRGIEAGVEVRNADAVA
jgi:hypothetical protein